MKIQVFPLELGGKKRIGIRPLGFDKAFPGLMKQILGSRWTPGEKCWHIPYSKEAYAELKRIFGEGQVIVLQERPEKATCKKEKGQNSTIACLEVYGGNSQAGAAITPAALQLQHGKSLQEFFHPVSGFLSR
jgi:hypothetical protein